MSDTELEKRVGREWSVPNSYTGFPEPKLVWIKTGPWMKDGGYYKAKCPVKGCKAINFLGFGYNQHYARTHAPEQWQQHAKRVIKAVQS